MKPEKPLKTAIRTLRERIEDMRREKITPEQEKFLTQDAYAEYRRAVRESLNKTVAGVSRAVAEAGE